MGLNHLSQIRWRWGDRFDIDPLNNTSYLAFSLYCAESPLISQLKNCLIGNDLLDANGG